MFTKCWIWQQCCNCEQRHSKTLQSKVELIQIDILVQKPGIDAQANSTMTFQDRHGRFLADKTPTVAAKSQAGGMPPLPPPCFIPQNSGKIVVLPVLPLLASLHFIK